MKRNPTIPRRYKQSRHFLMAVRASRAYRESVRDGVNAASDHLHRLGYKAAIRSTAGLDLFRERLQSRIHSLQSLGALLYQDSDHATNRVGKAFEISSFEGIHAGTPVKNQQHTEVAA